MKNDKNSKRINLLPPKNGDIKEKTPIGLWSIAWALGPWYTITTFSITRTLFESFGFLDYIFLGLIVICIFLGLWLGRFNILNLYTIGLVGISITTFFSAFLLPNNFPWEETAVWRITDRIFLAKWVFLLNLSLLFSSLLLGAAMMDWLYRYSRDPINDKFGKEYRRKGYLFSIPMLEAVLLGGSIELLGLVLSTDIQNGFLLWPAIISAITLIYISQNKESNKNLDEDIKKKIIAQTPTIMIQTKLLRTLTLFTNWIVITLYWFSGLYFYKIFTLHLNEPEDFVIIIAEIMIGVLIFWSLKHKPEITRFLYAFSVVFIPLFIWVAYLNYISLGALLSGKLLNILIAFVLGAIIWRYIESMRLYSKGWAETGFFMITLFISSYLLLMKTYFTSLVSAGSFIRPLLWAIFIIDLITVSIRYFKIPTRTSIIEYITYSKKRNNSTIEKKKEVTQ